MTAPMRTGAGPICAIASTNMSAVKNAANGTPTTASPIPANTDCVIAVTTIPSATLRTASPASSTAFTPSCGPTSFPTKLRSRRALRVQNCGNYHGEQKLPEQQPEISDLAQKPQAQPADPG